MGLLVLHLLTRNPQGSITLCARKARRCLPLRTSSFAFPAARELLFFPQGAALWCSCSQGVFVCRDGPGGVLVAFEGFVQYRRLGLAAPLTVRLPQRLGATRAPIVACHATHKTKQMMLFLLQVLLLCLIPFIIFYLMASCCRRRMATCFA